MAIVVNNKYQHGDVVYLKTDTEQAPGVIICFEIFKEGELLYKINRGTVTSYHYDFELTYEKNEIITV